MRKIIISLIAGIVLGVCLSVWSAFDPEEAFAAKRYAQQSNQKELISAAEDLGITADDVGRILEFQTGANHLKNPPEPGTSYSFSSLGPWIKTVAALFGLGVFFYLVRKKF